MEQCKIDPFHEYKRGTKQIKMNNIRSDTTKFIERSNNDEKRFKAGAFN